VNRPRARGCDANNCSPSSEWMRGRRRTGPPVGAGKRSDGLSALRQSFDSHRRTVPKQVSRIVQRDMCPHFGASFRGDRAAIAAIRKTSVVIEGDGVG
jgi:hypothetical protein